MTRQFFLDKILGHGWKYSWIYDGLFAPAIIFIEGDNLGDHEAIFTPLPMPEHDHKPVLEGIYQMIGLSLEEMGQAALA